MLRRLTYDGDYLMIDGIGATPAARHADVALGSTAHWAGLGWDGDRELTNPIVAVVLAPSFRALDQFQTFVNGSNHGYCTCPRWPMRRVHRSTGGCPGYALSLCFPFPKTGREASAALPSGLRATHRKHPSMLGQHPYMPHVVQVHWPG